MKKGSLLISKSELWLVYGSLEEEQMIYIEDSYPLLLTKIKKEEEFIVITLLYNDTLCKFTIVELDEVNEYFECVK
jgi:hypothetical protein